MKTFFMKGEIGWNITADKMKNFLSEANNADIAIVVSSPGGSVFDAYDIKNLLFDYKGKITFVFGSMVASAASYIAAIKGTERIVRGNSVWLHHNVSMITWGDYRTLRKDADFIEELTNIIAKDYVDVSQSKNIKQIRKEMDAETWLFGEEIVNEGFATRIAANDEKFDFIEYDQDNKESDFFQLMGISKDILIKNCKIKLKIVEEKCKQQANNINKSTNLYKKIDDILNKDSSFDNNIDVKGAERMDLKEFLDQSEEHKTAFNTYVEQKSKEKIDNYVKNVVEILELSGVAIPEIALNAIKSGKNVKEFAIDELKAQQKNKPGNSNYGNFIDSSTKGLVKQTTTEEQQKQIEAWDKAYDEANKKKGAK